MTARELAILRDKVARARLLEEPSSPGVRVEPVAGSAAGDGSSSGPLTERVAAANPDVAAASRSGERSMRQWALLYDQGVHYRKPFNGHCMYCGGRCHGRVCQWHRDLVQLEMEAH